MAQVKTMLQDKLVVLAAAVEQLILLRVLLHQDKVLQVEVVILMVATAAVVHLKLATQTATVLVETDLMRTQPGLVQLHQGQVDITQAAAHLMIKTAQAVPQIQA